MNDDERTRAAEEARERTLAEWNAAIRELAVAKLLLAHSHTVAKYARKLIREDAAQSALLGVYAWSDDDDVDWLDVHQAYCDLVINYQCKIVPPAVSKIMKRAAEKERSDDKRWRKWERLEEPAALDFVSAWVAAGAQADTAMHALREIIRLRDVLATLEPDEQTAFAWRAMCFSYAEIDRQFGWSQHTTRRLCERVYREYEHVQKKNERVRK